VRQHYRHDDSDNHAKEANQAFSTGCPTGKEPEQEDEETAKKGSKGRNHPERRWAIVDRASPEPGDQNAGY
jgi:hypothetical protein